MLGDFQVMSLQEFITNKIINPKIKSIGANLIIRAPKNLKQRLLS